MTLDLTLPVLAWEVEIKEYHMIVFTTSKKQAQWIATRDYWNAFGRNGWPRANAWRKPDMDYLVSSSFDFNRSYHISDF